MSADYGTYMPELVSILDSRPFCRPARPRQCCRSIGRVLIESDGSIRIAWNADGYEAIHVRARFRTREELADLAWGIADEALFDRTLPGLRVALRARYPGAFDLVTHEPQGRPWSVIVSFHPPPGTPRPDPW